MCKRLEYLNLCYDGSGDEARMIDIYLPARKAPYPVLIYFHGGGLTGGSRKGGETAVVKQLTESGIAVVSADYRLYPTAKFPEFVQDAAAAVSYAITFGKELGLFSQVFVGGASAGSYLSMMLFFDKHYLKDVGIDADSLSGFIFDAGQPTVHFNVLAERELDSRLIRVDEAAPIYFVDKEPEHPNTLPNLLILVSDNDMFGRYEQNQLLIKTMLHFGYDSNKINFHLMKGFGHCDYIEAEDEAGNLIYTTLIRDFIFNTQLES